ncbi:shikimate kinase [Clostridium botulinum C str. Eklund]|nr:shikimate kinase [Clostridium botulinum C str. Eklund]NEZ49120.1 shikimate kinase [Clostridium botulinum]
MKKLTKNIVLIGMPGCGKTTIGRKLSEILNADFCDVDEYIVDITGKSINEIFENGEEFFRDIESQSIKEVSSSIPKVISTGGGVIKRKHNIDVLKKKGTIFFINRLLEDICKDVDVKSRPLLKNGTDKLYKLYEERYDLYRIYCDYEIINEDMDKCISDILTYI